MIHEFKFPDVGEGITEGELVEWLVKEGDSVRHDQALAKVETDKALIDIPSPQDGIILKLHVKAGSTIKVGQTLVTFGSKGDNILPQSQSPQEHDSVGVVGRLEVSDRIIPSPKPAVQASIPAQQMKILPAIRILAGERGIDIAKITPSGSQGQITKQDVLDAAAGKSQAIAQQPKPVKSSGQQPEVKIQMKYDFYGPIEHVPIKGVRKAIAKKMEESWRNAVPVTHMDEVDVTSLVNIREKEKEKAAKKNIKLTYLPFIMKAVIEALKEHPYLNSSKEEDEIILKKYYNIGIAVETEDGLIVPVIKGADRKSILALANEIQEIAEKTKERKIDLADLQGGAFTITNIGSIGGVFATPIINYPECAILGLGKMQERPAFEGSKLVKKIILPLFITFDHRIADGAEAARFMNKVKESLQDPDWLLLEL